MKNPIYRDRQYECPNCGIFSVMHGDLCHRNRICAWCGKKVKETGKTTEVIGKWVIEKLWGKEVARWPIVKRK